MFLRAAEFCLSKTRIAGICSLQYARSFSSIAPTSLVCLDIDGVVLRGDLPIAGAGDAVRQLRSMGIPTMFLTNGSPCTEKRRARFLETVLNIHCDPDTVVMVQTPFSDFTAAEKAKSYFVLSGGDSKEIMKAIGFEKVVTLKELIASYPELDGFHKRFQKNKSKSCNHIGTVDGVIILDYPLEWETAYQYLIDLVVTEGQLDKTNDPNYNYSRALQNKNWRPIPFYLGGHDFLATSEVPLSRLATGAFLAGFESIYHKVVGSPVKYSRIFGKPGLNVYKFVHRKIASTWPSVNKIYFVGDNPLTDIYGANVFKEFVLKDSVTLDVRSVLVKSGVYKGESSGLGDCLSTSIKLLHGSSPKIPTHLEPDFVFQDLASFVRNIEEEEEE